MTSFAQADKPALLAELRNRIRRLEGVGGEGCRVLPLGSAIDAALPDGGLPLGCLHELVADEDCPASERAATAATAFAAALLARIAGPVLWIGKERDLFAPGLAVFGLTPDRLVVVRARRTEDVLWAMEEALRSRGIGGVLGEVAGVDLTAGRRLQLAAEAGGATGFLLRRGRGEGRGGGTGEGGGESREVAGCAVTRWVLSSAPSLAAPGEPGVGVPRWRARLVRCRGGRPGDWLLEWHPDGFRADGFRAEPVTADTGSAMPGRRLKEAG